MRTEPLTRWLLRAHVVFMLMLLHTLLGIEEDLYKCSNCLPMKEYISPAHSKLLQLPSFPSRQVI